MVEQSGVLIPEGTRDFLFSKISKTVLWLGTWWLFSGGKEAGPEAGDSPASSAEVQN